MEAREDEEIVLRDQSLKEQAIEMALNVVYYGVMIGLTYLAYRFDQSDYGTESVTRGTAYNKK